MQIEPRVLGVAEASNCGPSLLCTRTRHTACYKSAFGRGEENTIHMIDLRVGSNFLDLSNSISYTANRVIGRLDVLLRLADLKFDGGGNAQAAIVTEYLVY